MVKQKSEKVDSQRVVPYPQVKPQPKFKHPENARSDFRNFVDDMLGDLSNEAHAIFAVKNFPEHTAQRYNALLPCLRLASHLITHGSVKPLFRTILTHGAWVDLHEKVGHLDENGHLDETKESEAIFSYSQFDSDLARPVTTQESSRIDAALEELSMFVIFSPDTELTMGSGATDELDKERVPQGAKILTGVRSKTRYSESAVQMLEGATNNIGTDQEDIALLLALRFSLAITFAHEVAHALVFAADGRKPPYNQTETFFHDEPVAEIGFALEKSLFGGTVSSLWHNAVAFAGQRDVEVRIHQKRPTPSVPKAKRTRVIPWSEFSELRGAIVVWEWPCRWIAEDYQDHNAGLWMRADAHTTLRQKDVAWRIYMSDTSKFFSNAFWTSSSSDTLMFDRRVGQSFIGWKAEGKGVVPIRHHLTDRETKTDRPYVPEDYKYSRALGDIYRP